MRVPLRPQWLKSRPLLWWLPRAPAPVLVPRRIATTSTTNTAPIDLPKLILSPGSPHHNSLPSFLEFAKKQNLNIESTTYKGTHYEYTTALALMRLGFSLLRIGRSGDAGIDLIGHWILAPLREPFPVIIQCKARRASLNPCHMRELEGSFQGIPADWRRKDVLGLLICTKKATKGTLEAMGQSRWPMGYVLITRTGLIQQFVWNRVAAEKGLAGVGVTLRHTPRAMLSEDEIDEADHEIQDLPKRNSKFKSTGYIRDIQLTWMGSPIFPERKDIARDTLKLMRHVVPGDDSDQGIAKFIDIEKKKKSGRPRSVVLPPSPRGGMVEGPGGRAAAQPPKVKVPGRKPGRPLGPKARVKVPGRKPGRPPGSKNKPKVAV